MAESDVPSLENTPELFESETTLALTKRAELAEERLSKVAGILKETVEAEHSVSYSDPKHIEKVNRIRARALNKLDCVVSYLNE